MAWLVSALGSAAGAMGASGASSALGSAAGSLGEIGTAIGSAIQNGTIPVGGAKGLKGNAAGGMASANAPGLPPLPEHQMRPVRGMFPGT